MAERGRRRGALWIVLVAVVLVATVGGLAVWHFGVPREEPAPRVIADPVTVEPGEAFEVGAVSVQPGWRLRSSSGVAVVEDVQVTITGERREYIAFDITLKRDGQALAVISCSSHPLEPGDSFVPQCLGSDPIPRSYDRIVVSDRHT